MNKTERARFVVKLGNRSAQRSRPGKAVLSSQRAVPQAIGPWEGSPDLSLTRAPTV